MVTQVDIGHGRGWLAPPAAASLRRIDAELGHAMQTTETGRSFFQQEAHWLRYVAYLNGGPWAPLAAKPSTSPHEFGNAVDSNEAQRILSIMLRHGWRRPLKFEPWHFVYNYALDQHRFDPAPAGSGSSTATPVAEGGFLMSGGPLADDQIVQMYHALVAGGLSPDAYYKTDATVGVLREELKPMLTGIVARVDAANTRLATVIDSMKQLAPGREVDIAAIEAKLRESEDRTSAATAKMLEDAVVALRAEIVVSVAGTMGLPVEAITDSVTEAVNAVLDTVFVRDRAAI